MKKSLFLSLILVGIISCQKPDVLIDKVVPTAIEPDAEIASITIQTTNNAAISTKTTYVEALLTITGIQKYESFNEKIGIKGRGNTTWDYPKKPYHIEFVKTKNMFDLGEDKDWVLIANYLDFNHLLNAAGLKVGADLGMAFTPKFKPVELIVNGSYQGLYLLTEQIEREKKRVNIDEGGCLLELDQYYNDANKFRSANYNLPVNIKYPKIADATAINKIKADFSIFENSIKSANFPTNNYKDFVDLEAMADYFIVSYLTDNQEINHPKSVFMHKNANGKFIMGPVWDFDWAFSFNYNESYFNWANGDLFWKPAGVGTSFFSRFLLDPTFKAIFKKRWLNYKSTKFDSMLVYIEDYSKLVEKARKKDANKWRPNNPVNYTSELSRFKSWMSGKATFIDNMVKDW
jgi:CotH kinase protein